MPAIEVVKDCLKGLVGNLNGLTVTIGPFEFVDVEKTAVEIGNASEEFIELGIASPASKTFVKEPKQEVSVE
jgi:hypothetical protein